jgi:hypothetical protein
VVPTEGDAVAGFDINGTWEGEYSFDPCEALPEPPPSVGFTLTAQGGWFGGFRGVIQDDPARGVPDPASVTGSIAGLALTFTKRYPALFVRHRGRCVRLLDYLESEQGLRPDQDVPGLAFVYEGYYEPVHQSASGRWWYNPQRILFRIGGEFREIRFPAVSGRWVMRRQSSG